MVQNNIDPYWSFQSAHNVVMEYPGRDNSLSGLHVPSNKFVIVARYMQLAKANL
jgi:hypothetical protein